MSDSLSRRDALKALGAAATAGLIPTTPTHAEPVDTRGAPLAATPSAVPQVTGEIVPLSSTSEVFTPARGDSFMRFSFDFPEPSVVFGPHRFGFVLFTNENTYSLDLPRMRAEGNDDAMRLTCDSFVWAGGQEKVSGKFAATFRRSGQTIEWDVSVTMPHPVKTVTTVIRDVPKGPVSFGGGGFVDPRDGDLLGGYTFGAGDLHGAFSPIGMTTPIAVLQAADADFLAFSTLDERVRPKRFLFQQGEKGFRVEAIYEHDAWRNDTTVKVPTWRLLRATTFEEAMAPHMAHIERAHALPAYETRADAPAWMRDLALVTTFHGQHYTGYIFNDYAKQLEILRWMATQIPAERVLVFLASWDGRYYWDYPNYTVPERMGGEAGFRRLISEGQKMGFKMMPMFGANSANRQQPSWEKIKGGATYKLDGDLYNLNWVDWNNDRHQDGWLTYMNLGHDAWRNHITGRIAETIERFGVDAYFLDIVGGHVNATTGDMHEGTKRMISDLRTTFPKVACVGEMPYDALYGFIPMFHAGGGGRWRKYARFYSHLSAPAPGRGSSGVHEAGFQHFNTETLGLSPNAIPTLQVVDDTFSLHRDTMAAVIARAKQRAGIG
jgi:hypothetical protein